MVIISCSTCNAQIDIALIISYYNGMNIITSEQAGFHPVIIIFLGLAEAGRGRGGSLSSEYVCIAANFHATSSCIIIMMQRSPSSSPVRITVNMSYTCMCTCTCTSLSVCRKLVAIC